MEGHIVSVMDCKYQLKRAIGEGSFGNIYIGVSMESGIAYTLKVERRNQSHQQLFHENKIYKELSGGEGIPKVLQCGNDNQVNILVMDLLGPSLEDLFNFCSRRFTLKTVLMLVDQMLKRLEFIHSKHYIHRNIIPENFLIGIDEDCLTLFLIDFSLAKMYRNPQTMKHIRYETDIDLIGTLRYSSINTHLGIEQSRRDDMESLGYVIMYFIRGDLPWQGIKAVSKKQKYEKIGEIKSSTSIRTLCKDLPAEFGIYLNYCRVLQFEDEPDYEYLIELFRTFGHSLNYQYDHNYDWIILRQKILAQQANTEPANQAEEESPTTKDAL